MKEHSNANTVPAKMQSIFESITNLTDEFCGTYFNDEYARLSKVLAAALSRKSPTGFVRVAMTEYQLEIDAGRNRLRRIEELFERHKDQPPL